MVAVETLILTAIVGRAAADLDSMLQNESRLAWDVKQEMKNLKSVVSTINTALQEAEVKPAYSQAMIEWLQELHDAADDAMILLDSLSSKVTPLILSNRFPFVNNPARDIKEVKEKLEKIEKRKVFILKAEGKEPVVAVEEATEPSLPYSEIYEREQAKDEIVKFLLDTTCQEEISVIPITGFRGIGKTTLAKLAFNDMMVKQHFSKGWRKWIWVTDGMDAKKIAQGIIQSLLRIPCDNLGLDQLKDRFKKILPGRKFLLVLDNVWNESRIWDELMYILRGNHGVKIIVTTSNNWVANIMKTTSPCYLEGLTESACWSIFAQTAFQEGQNMNRFYEESGRKIANKSRGVPRAVEALGRLMRKTTDHNRWSKVTSSEIWSLPEEQNEIFPALRLSYKDLPLYSYRCLAYCSIFPRDYEMDKEIIIKQWIAHDFIPSDDDGHEAFNHFLDRFFFQPLQKDEDGRVLTFKLQGLIYDLARFEMKNSINRHLCCDVSTILDAAKEVPNHKYLRTLFHVNTPGRCLAKVPQSIDRFKLLRVLDLSYTDVTSFPSSVATLHQLRYLDLSGTKIETLPKVICHLKNLQSLILKRCSKLSKLPAKMRKMVRLIHLDIDECKSLVQMPTLIGQLRCLQTLPVFIVGETGSSIGELGTLNLRDKLNIKYLENVVSDLDAKGANLKCKEHLRSLSLSWEKDRKINSKAVAQVLDALEPPKYLKRLSIAGFTGEGFPGWLNSLNLQDLVGVALTNCKSCVHLPPLGEFPFLKSLTIEGLASVQYLGKSFYGSNTKVFPSLKNFSCLDMISLKSWAESRELFPHLEILIIKRCPKLSNLPKLLSRPSKLEHLEIEECPELKSVKEIESLCALKMLKMIHCEGLKSLPEGLSNLTSLEHLEVDNCHNLTSLPLKGIEGLQSLRTLLIQKCRNLISLSEGLQHLTSLRKMTIIGCPKLFSPIEGRQYLTSLQFLTIHGCVKLATLPKGPLKDLQISGSPSLIASPEWAKNLKHLQSLVIENCQNLQCLPPEMKTMTALKKLQICNCHSLIELPLWLTELAALQNLNISNCSSLKRIPAGLRQKTTLCLVIERCSQFEWYAERSRSWKRALESDGDHLKVYSQRRRKNHVDNLAYFN